MNLYCNVLLHPLLMYRCTCGLEVSTYAEFYATINECAILTNHTFLRNLK